MKWIRVTDEKPTGNEYQLMVTNERFGCWVGKAYYMTDWDCFVKSYPGEGDPLDVTHWIALPELPYFAFDKAQREKK